MKRAQKEEKTIQAYRIVQEQNLMPFIHGTRKELSTTKLFPGAVPASSFIFGGDKKAAEIVARQFLLLRFSLQPFSERILRAAAFGETISQELPPVWKKILRGAGFRVDGFGSSCKFYAYVFKRLVKNLYDSFAIIIPSFFSKTNDAVNQKKYVHFLDLTKNCLPWSGADKDYTIINWYIHWQENVGEFYEIHHNVKARPAFAYKSVTVKPSRQFIAYLSGTVKKIQLLCWFLGAAIIAFFSFFLGRWMNALLLFEALQAKIVGMTRPELLANEYLFSLSSFEYRPLWTYEAEKKGSLVTNFSYATSFGGFKSRNGYVDVEYYFDITTWPRLLYWSDDYISFIRSKVSPAVKVMHVAEPICYSDHPFTFPFFPEKTVAVFDVTPVDPYTSAKLLPELQYRTFENGKRFLTDIYEAFGKNGFTIVWKRKRGFGSIHNRDYILFCDEFEKLPNVVVIHPDVSAFHVIEECSCSISMPFTSTAFVAKYFKKPSVFYDGTQILYKDDRGAQGVPLISGIDELTDWCKQVSKENSI
jgi:polysaccharide biosynthesis PFTS motif protein